MSQQVPLNFDQCVLMNVNFDQNKFDELVLTITHTALAHLF